MVGRSDERCGSRIPLCVGGAYNNKQRLNGETLIFRTGMKLWRLCQGRCAFCFIRQQSALPGSLSRAQGKCFLFELNVEVTIV